MNKPNIENLLQLFSDYRSFCQTSGDSVLSPHTFDCEFSEDELDMVAAAAYTPPSPIGKNENP